MDDQGNDPAGNGDTGTSQPPWTPPAPPAFTAPAAFPAAAPPPTVPPMPPGPPADPSAPPRVPEPADPDGHGRPMPTLASMLAVGAGLLVAAGLFFLLGEVNGFDQRGVALAHPASWPKKESINPSQSGGIRSPIRLSLCSASPL